MKQFIEAAREALLHRASVLDATPGTAHHVEQFAIEQALKRIEAQTYGWCERCTGPIGMQRLKAMPETSRCASCAEAATTTHTP